MEICQIGIHSVGKMYKPREIKTIENGFSMKTKIKSNYGGKFEVEIYCMLDYQDKDAELILVNIDSKLPILVREDVFRKIEKDMFVTNTSEKIPKTDRHIVKPDDFNYRKYPNTKRMYVKEGVLYYPLTIYSKIEDDCEEIEIAFYVTVIDEEEYLVIECNLSNASPIVLSSLVSEIDYVENKI